MWAYKNYPPRVWVFLLRLFLFGEGVALEVYSDVRNRKKGLLSSGFDHVPLNRKKVRDSFSGNTLELKLLSLSGDLNELRTEVQSFESMSN